MSKYQNGKIYKIVNDTLNLTYYGSTCQKYLHSRFYKHKKQDQQYSSYKLFEEGEAKIFLVELFPCESKLELEKRERYYIENNECVNMKIPTRTSKEWREANKDKLESKRIIYYEKNKEIIKEKQKILDARREKCPHCNKEILKKGMNRHIKRKHST